MIGLPRPARYTPWANGSYDVSPSLRPLGTDFGNGSADKCVFQLDCERDRFRRNKRQALSERVSKYVLRDRLSVDVERAAINLIADRLQTEYVDRFEIKNSDRGPVLAGEGGRTLLDPTLQAVGAGLPTTPPLDRLALQVQEDFAIVSTQGSRDWVSYLNVCAPSHWAPEDKIGRPFANVHVPVVGFERVNSFSSGLVRGMVHSGPFVRFAWTIESDFRLNHHPSPAPGWSFEEWNGRDFSHGFFWVRVERQVIWGMPAVGAALFTIRLNFMRSDEILADETLRETLLSSLNSMSPESRVYKGLSPHWDQLLAIFNGA